MTLSRCITRASVALLSVAVAHATDFPIHGSLTPGLHVYPGNVIVDDDLFLSGDTTIRAVGGYVRVEHAIFGEGAADGADGAPGTVCDVEIAPSPGQPGARGIDLTIETRPSFTGVGPGDVDLRAPIYLKGKNGGAGGDGANNDCFNPCVHHWPQNGARGGDGGRGGNLAVTSCGQILVRNGCFVESHGGNSGRGGNGGRFAGLIAQDIGGKGAEAGTAGVGGITTLQQSADFHAGDNILIDYGFAVYSNGGHAGAGGNGGSSLLIGVPDDYKGGMPGDGASGVAGGAGGALRIFGRSKILNSNFGYGSISFWAFGGNGGAGGIGGWSGRAYCQCGCGPLVACIGALGGQGGTGGTGGQGGSIDVRNLAGRTITLQSMYVQSRGGVGGASGNCGQSGQTPSGCECGGGLIGVDAFAAAMGGAGGLLSFVSGNTQNGLVDLSFSGFNGEGFRGGLGGTGGASSSCGWCDECPPAGDGGRGGAGGRGSNLVVTGFRITMRNCLIDLDGGDGGMGGGGGGYQSLGGAGGGVGADGSFVPTGALVDLTGTMFQNDTASVGQAGLDGPPCPSGPPDCP